MRHYRDPDATNTQAIAARLAAAGEQTVASAPVSGVATGAAPTASSAPAFREPSRQGPPSVRVGTARARGAAAP